MRFSKKGAEWTISKLLAAVFAVIIIVLVIWGMYTGGLQPLGEKIGGQIDKVLIMFNLRDEPPVSMECFDVVSVDIADLKVSGSSGVKTVSGSLRRCRDRCELVLDEAVSTTAGSNRFFQYGGNTIDFISCPSTTSCEAPFVFYKSDLAFDYASIESQRKVFDALKGLLKDENQNDLKFLEEDADDVFVISVFNGYKTEAPLAVFIRSNEGEWFVLKYKDTIHLSDAYVIESTSGIGKDTSTVFDEVKKYSDKTFTSEDNKVAYTILKDYRLKLGEWSSFSDDVVKKISVDEWIYIPLNSYEGDEAEIDGSEDEELFVNFLKSQIKTVDEADKLTQAQIDNFISSSLEATKVSIDGKDYEIKGTLFGDKPVVYIDYEGKKYGLIDGYGLIDAYEVAIGSQIGKSTLSLVEYSSSEGLWKIIDSKYLAMSDAMIQSRINAKKIYELMKEKC